MYYADFIGRSRREKDTLKTAWITTLHRTIDMRGAPQLSQLQQNSWFHPDIGDLSATVNSLLKVNWCKAGISRLPEIF